MASAIRVRAGFEAAREAATVAERDLAKAIREAWLYGLRTRADADSADARGNRTRLLCWGMRTSPRPSATTFVERAERIARVHQFGLSDRMMPGGPTYRYPARELIEITANQVERIRDLIQRYLGT